ncbi:glycoside hydrolase family 20 protein [Tieghemostelium lacteum]|uniref:Glycoside hydrolase family 20 protein n=1 Tax=Tieghemostelium lacteum TaxID=361077 RepID=A0A152A919_TIELA|nr:glycoside hydrolase family 20 protein [Tieghemostelium lacteum]|eukprot:KYR02722.1 glycoside hydrolase family 20 protein [Tieghemostelium lacteum]
MIKYLTIALIATILLQVSIASWVTTVSYSDPDCTNEYGTGYAFPVNGCSLFANANYGIGIHEIPDNDTMNFGAYLLYPCSDWKGGPHAEAMVSAKMGECLPSFKLPASPWMTPFYYSLKVTDEPYIPDNSLFFKLYNAADSCSGGSYYFQYFSNGLITPESLFYDPYQMNCTSTGKPNICRMKGENCIEKIQVGGCNQWYQTNGIFFNIKCNLDSSSSSN